MRLLVSLIIGALFTGATVVSVVEDDHSDDYAYNKNQVVEIPHAELARDEEFNDDEGEEGDDSNDDSKWAAIEAARVEREKAAQQEASRVAAEKVAAEKAAQEEAARVAAEKAAQAEAQRIAAQKAAQAAAAAAAQRKVDAVTQAS